MVTTVTSKRARSEWGKLLDSVQMGKTVIIERRGKPAAVLISFEEFERLQEALAESHAIAEAVAAYKEWKRDPSVVRPYSQVRRNLLTSIENDE